MPFSCFPIFELSWLVFDFECCLLTAVSRILVSCLLRFNMRDIYLSHTLSDNGGRRIGIERRRFSYADHIPERRCGEDRRKGTDRRAGADRRTGMDRRAATDRRTTSRGDRREKANRRGQQERRYTDRRQAMAL